jgi:succinoglycan biosynthesis transport protein ExoP
VWPVRLARPEADLRALERKRQKMIEAAAAKVLEGLKERVEQARREEDRLDREVRRLGREVDRTLPGSQKAPPDVAAKRARVEQLERELRRVGDELAALEGSLPLAPRATVHAPAVPAAEKDYGRTLKFALAAALGAFGLALAGLCFAETLGRRVYASDDVSQGLGLPVVGTLPALPARARRKAAPAGVPSALDARCGLTEAVDALRTVLLHAPKADGARVILVSSASTGEGKTTLASHLAASLARAWRKTLLIDGDLRSPGQHARFDVPAGPGLSEALRGEVEMDDVVQPTAVSRLWLLPAGRADGHALQALAQDTLAELFDHLKEQYDFIVLDTSPVLPVPDAMLLARHADVVLLAVLKNVSRAPAVHHARERLESLGIRVFGAVVIGEKTETYGRPVPYPQA